MGIKPSGSNPVIVPPDNTQTRWGEWEVSIDTAGQQAGEVFAETHAIATSANTIATGNSAQVQKLLADSAGLGDESKTIQQQMRELLDPNNPESELWALQNEVNRLNDERNDLQDQMIDLNRKGLDGLENYVSRSIFIPRDAPIQDDYFSVVRHPSSSHRWRVIAKPGWAGHYVWQSTYYFDAGDASPVIDGRQVGIDRQWDEYAWNRNQSILTYWVRRGEHKSSDVTSGAYSTGLNAWTTRSDLTFHATTTAPHDLFYRVKWGAATYGDDYSFRIRKNNSVTLLQWGPYTKVGPRFPWESGVRTRTISEFGVPLNAGDVITFETYSDASQDSQRLISESERKISWLVA